MFNKRIKLKKAICIGLSCLMIMLMSGCSAISKVIKRALDSSKQPTNLEISQNILDCFDNEDTQGLKALLCPKTQGIEDIEEQIREGFDFLDGKVVSFDENVSNDESESVDHGTTEELSRTLHIEDITTDTGGTYKLYVSINLIYIEDEDREGITDITIVNEDNDTTFQIGYTWPDHHTEGRKISTEIIKALGEGDSEALKDTLCEETLEISDIDGQIQAAFDFFEGKALMGKVEGGPYEYDGKHDFKTTVSDDEVIEGNEPISTSVYVYCTNIETDSDRVYELEFYAYLLSDEHEEYEGVSQITIFDENGDKLVIGDKIS